MDGVRLDSGLKVVLRAKRVAIGREIGVVRCGCGLRWVDGWR